MEKKSYNMQIKFKFIKYHGPVYGLIHINILSSVIFHECTRNRGYYMAARGYEYEYDIFECWKYLSRVSEANEWEILSAWEDKIRIPARPCNVLFIL